MAGPEEDFDARPMNVIRRDMGFDERPANPVRPSGAPAIVAGLDDVSDLLDRVVDRVLTLEDRLRPVVTPVMEENDQDPRAVKEFANPDSPLAGRLRVFTERLRLIDRRLVDLKDRVEL